MFVLLFLVPSAALVSSLRGDYNPDPDPDRDVGCQQTSIYYNVRAAIDTETCGLDSVDEQRQHDQSLKKILVIDDVGEIVANPTSQEEPTALQICSSPPTVSVSLHRSLESSSSSSSIPDPKQHAIEQACVKADLPTVPGMPSACELECEPSACCFDMGECSEGLTRESIECRTTYAICDKRAFHKPHRLYSARGSNRVLEQEPEPEPHEATEWITVEGIVRMKQCSASASTAQQILMSRFQKAHRPCEVMFSVTPMSHPVEIDC